MELKPIIYVCSPLRGDIYGNIKKAVSYSLFVYKQGGIPLAPHTIFTQYLDDKIPEEREAGIEMGLQLLLKCDELWAFGDKLSEGMIIEIAAAKSFDLKVKRYNSNFEALEVEHDR